MVHTQAMVEVLGEMVLLLALELLAFKWFRSSTNSASDSTIARQAIITSRPRPDGCAQVSVLYASQGGKSRRFAEDLHRSLVSNNIRSSVRDLSEAFGKEKSSSVLDFNLFFDKLLTDSSHVIFVLSTFGNGQPPRRARGFSSALSSYAKQRRSGEGDVTVTDEHSLSFAVFGCGCRQYEHFNKFARDVDTLLGDVPLSRRMVDVGLGDDDGGLNLAHDFRNWKSSLLATLHRSIESSHSEVPAASTSMDSGAFVSPPSSSSSSGALVSPSGSSSSCGVSASGSSSSSGVSPSGSSSSFGVCPSGSSSSCGESPSGSSSSCGETRVDASSDAKKPLDYRDEAPNVSRIRSDDIVWDAVIIGGGPAGSAAATTMARAGLKVMLVDQSDPSAYKIGESLVPNSKPALRRLGFDMTQFEVSEADNSSDDSHNVRGKHRRYYGNESLWGHSDLDAVDSADFLRHPFGFGWHVDRAAFDAQLRAHARSCGADVRERTRVTRWERVDTAEDDSDDPHWRLSLELLGDHVQRYPLRESTPNPTADFTPNSAAGATPNPAAESSPNTAVDVSPNSAATVRCNWLVDCSGRRSRVSHSQSGVETLRTDRLVCVYARIPRREDAPPDAVDQSTLTVVESAASGWWYTSLLPTGQQRLVCFHTDADTHAAHEASTAAGFLELLRHTTLVRKRVDPAIYDLSASSITIEGTTANTAHLDQLFDPLQRWIAAGDAAMSFDPLSSQGMLSALQGGAACADAVCQCLAEDMKMAQSQAPNSARFPHSLSDVTIPVRRALVGYSQEMRTVLADYHTGRQHFYASETRFKDDVFWRRRHGQTSMSG